VFIVFVNKTVGLLAYPA